MKNQTTRETMKSNQKNIIRTATPRFRHDEHWMSIADVVTLGGIGERSKTSRYAEKLPSSLVQKVKAKDASGTLQDTLFVHTTGAVTLLCQLTKPNTSVHEFALMLTSGRLQAQPGQFEGPDYIVKPVPVEGLKPYKTTEEVEWQEQYAGKTDTIQLRTGQWAIRTHGQTVGDVRIKPIDDLIHEKVRQYMSNAIWGVRGSHACSPADAPKYKAAEALWDYIEECKTFKTSPTAIYISDQDRVAYMSQDGTVRDLETGEVLAEGSKRHVQKLKAAQARMEALGEDEEFTPGVHIKQ